MSYATLALTIAFFINLFIFLAGQPAASAPMLALIKMIATGSGNVDWGAFFTAGRLLWMLAIAGIIGAASFMLSPPASLTGSFATIHAVTVVAIAVFVTFFALPNFAFMAIPEPLASIISMFFGFIILQAILGFLGGGR